MKLLDTLLWHLFYIPTPEMKEQEKLEKEELKKHKAFINYKCPFCGKYFSYETYEKYVNRTYYARLIIDSNNLSPLLNHGCTHEYQENEKIAFFKCSTSVNPIKEATVIVRLDDKEENTIYQFTNL